MNSDKTLTTSERTKIYQRDKLVDSIQFLFPKSYQTFDITKSNAVLQYTDLANIAHAEVLVKDEELYKDMVRFTLPLDTSITRYAGDIILFFTLSYVDTTENTQYVLHTGEATVNISPLKDLYAFVPDESLAFVDQMIGTLDAKLQATEKMAEAYDKNKADNLVYENNSLQLTSNGEKIGKPVTILSGEGGNIDEQLEKAKNEAIAASKNYTDKSLTIIEF